MCVHSVPVPVQDRSGASSSNAHTGAMQSQVPQLFRNVHKITSFKSHAMVWPQAASGDQVLSKDGDTTALMGQGAANSNIRLPAPWPSASPKSWHPCRKEAGNEMMPFTRADTSHLEDENRILTVQCPAVLLCRACPARPQPS